MSQVLNIEILALSGLGIKFFDKNIKTLENNFLFLCYNWKELKLLFMTTITFEKSINLSRRNFRDLLDFKDYLENNFLVTKLMELKDEEVTLDIIKEMQRTKEMDKSSFVNLFQN